MSGARPLHKGLVNMQIYPGSNTAWVPLALAKGCRRVSYFITQAEEIGIKRLVEKKGSKKKSHTQQKSWAFSFILVLCIQIETRR